MLREPRPVNAFIASTIHSRRRDEAEMWLWRAGVTRRSTHGRQPAGVRQLSVRRLAIEPHIYAEKTLGSTYHSQVSRSVAPFGTRTLRS